MKKTRVAVVGCGSVSGAYMPHLVQSPFVEIVAVCDEIVDRAEGHAKKFGVDRFYQNIDDMLKEVEFELFVNLTSMPSHGPLNRKALQADKNVWCEKPIATDIETAYELLELAKDKGLGFWGAPNSIGSPAFEFMHEKVSSGALGKVFMANGVYGHSGPEWGPWFYSKEGGALNDLGVYNIATLTGLLGPVESVMAEVTTAIPERVVEGKTIQSECDDNAAVIMNHGGGVYSVIQTGFVYAAQKEDWTMQIVGTEGAMALGGYDWDPENVQLYTKEQGKWENIVDYNITRSSTGGASQPAPEDTATGHKNHTDYAWQGGASYIAECLATGKEPIFQAEHALHFLDIMLSAKRSAELGQRVKVESSFKWPMI